jgi:uncharacterized membrane protein
MKPWPRRILITLALAVGLHAAAVWLVPRAIVATFIKRGAAQMGLNHANAGSLPTDRSRAVVRPSPDLLYAVCLYDVGQHPLLLESELPDSYWSLSLFAANSDNFIALNDRQIEHRPARYLLAADAQSNGLRPDLANLPVIVAPTAKGVALFRNLVLDPTAMTDAEAAQHSARCTPVGG